MADLPLIPLCIPLLNGHERRYVDDCLATGWISSVGRYVARFEQDFAAYVGQGTQAVAVINGTSALHLALLVAGVGPGQEVAVNALTFIAPVNAICYTGAVPVFVDADAASLGMSAAALRELLTTQYERTAAGLVNRHSGRRLTTILVVHVLGHASDLDALQALAEEFGLRLLEDAAEAIGTQYRGRHVGTVGDFGCFSFNGNKLLSTGGGGMVISRDPVALARVRHLSTQAKSDAYAFIHDAVGYNYRLSNVHAAIGVGQLEHLDAMLARKRALHARFTAFIGGFPGLVWFSETAWCRSNYWLGLLVLPDLAARQAAAASFARQRIDVRPFWEVIARLPLYQASPCTPLPVAAALHARSLQLPLHAGLTDDDADRIEQALRTVASSLGASAAKQPPLVS